jgi:hypothetical protein
MPFEYVVRPFQSRDSYGRIIIPSVPGGTQRATLTWGAKTSIVPTSLAHQVRFQYVHDPNDPVTCCQEVSLQASNEMETVQIVNEGSGGGQINVKRAKSLRLQKQIKNACDDQPPWEPQFDASSQSVFDNMATEAAQMGVREPTIEKCRVLANFSN